MDADNRSSDRNLNIQGDVDKSIIILGDGNTVQCVNVLSTINLPPSNPVVSHSMSKDEYRWRQLLINKVRHYWIEGVLEKSLHNQSLIELGLSECNTAITSLLNGVEEFSDEAQMFPEGTQAADIFDSLGTGRTLLVLGDPGAGKTTMLLKLAQGLLDRIDDDLSQPIPVILNLSSWAKKRQPIADWLVQSIYETFQIRRSVGKAWLSQEQLVLCLDGLDEVKAEHRNDCVNALNQFIQRHGRTEIVVCSRLKDYESISEKLRLQSAIYVQPLTSKQVDLYLEQVGETLRALRSVLNHSAALKAFASSPLILSMMSLAYQGCSVDDIKQNGTLEEYRRTLFDTYTKRMFQSARLTAYTKQISDGTQQYTVKQSKYWLIAMAKVMNKGSESVFSIERFLIEGWYLDWFPDDTLSLVYSEAHLQVFLYCAVISIVFLKPWVVWGLTCLLVVCSAGLLAVGLICGIIRWVADGRLVALFCVSIVGLGIELVLGPGLKISHQPGLGLCLWLAYCTFVWEFELYQGLMGRISGRIYSFVMRCVLYRLGYIPWNYSRFLDYATERLFLQKVGDGYIFIHRMLLEYFAQMKLEPSSKNVH